MIQQTALNHIDTRSNVSTIVDDNDLYMPVLNCLTKMEYKVILGYSNDTSNQANI